MRLCSYVVKWDRGLAPNPFWGYCTLAVCTPNHMGIRAQNGDWFIGTETVERGNKLIFAMRVAEVLRFDQYHSDPRFDTKKPVVNGTWRQRCGDNDGDSFPVHTEFFETHRCVLSPTDKTAVSMADRDGVPRCQRAQPRCPKHALSPVPSSRSTARSARQPASAERDGMNATAVRSIHRRPGCLQSATAERGNGVRP